MNLTGEDVATFVLAALWRASWQGGIAVACVSLLEFAAPSLPAQARSWLWRLVFVKFAVTLVWSTGIPLPILPPPQAAAVHTVVSESELSPAVTESSDTSTPATSPAWNLTYTLVGCWAIGTAIVLYRQRRSGRQPQRDVRWSAPLVADDLQQALRFAAGRLGLAKLPPLRRITGPGGPRLVGVWRPQLLFPETWLAQCTATQRRLAIAHELAHVARHDLAWNRLAAWCQAVFFFHPLVWWAGRRYLLAQELACDALVLTKVEAAPGEYARLLYDLMNQPAGAMWDGSAAMTGAWVTLRERVWAMKQGTGLRPTWAAGLAITLGATLGLAPFSLAQQKIVSPSEESAATPKKPVIKNGVSASASASGSAIANGNGQAAAKVQANASVNLGGDEPAKSPSESPNDRPKSPGESPNDRPAKSTSASRVKQTMSSEDNGDGEKWTRTTEATEGKREIRIEETQDEIRVVTRIGDEEKVVTGKDAADLRRQSQAAFDTYRKYVKDGKGVSASAKAGNAKGLSGGKAFAGGNAGGKAFGNAGGNAFGGGNAGGNAFGDAGGKAFGNVGGNAFGDGDAGGFNAGGDPKEALRQFRQSIEASGIRNPAFDEMLKELEAELDK